MVGDSSRARMASRLPDVEEQDEDECEPAESKGSDNTVRSDSTFGTESPEAGGGGHPTPEDESTTSIRSEELDSEHQINCTFSVSLAVPVVLPTNKPVMASRQDIPRSASKMRDSYIPKMHRFYHIEYFLLPDDVEPRKLDLVLFGPVAKLFLETESKVVRPWLEHDQLWVSWNHSVEINVTTDFLMKLRDHSIKLRLWDTKDKVCSKAKYSKAKATAPPSDQGSLEVKHMISLQRNFLEQCQPKASYTKIKPPEVSPISEKSAVGVIAGSPTSAASKHLDADSDAFIERKTSRKSVGAATRSLSAFSISGSIPSSLKERTLQEAKSIKQKLHSKPHSKLTASAIMKTGKMMDHSERKETPDEGHHQLPEKKKPSRVLDKRSASGTQKSSKESATSTALTKKFGIAFLELNLMPLLSGQRCVVSQLGEKSPKLWDAYLSFSVEGTLMSEKQKHELNPLIIKINSARCLPDTPVPIKVLQNSCLPIYCKYKFHNMEPHRTPDRDHGSHVFFKDTNVVLAGTIRRDELTEYLRGPPLEIEVHDRDKKWQDVDIKPSLFGEEPGDCRLSHLSSVTSKYVAQNPLKGMEEMWHPYGVARIRLAELLLGEKALNFCAPIHNCPIRDTRSIRKAKDTDGSPVAQMPAGHYVCSGAFLKVRVEIAVPLSPEDEAEDTKDDYCPYGCIIYVFDYKNTSLISYLLQEITKINAEALELDSYPLRIIHKSLNALKLNNRMTYEEICQLDVLTGFHILDGSIHLLVVEGLKNKALKRLWNKRIDRLHESKIGRLKIFYNSHFSFHQRLYVDLEAILLHIRLCKPLSNIVNQPLLYIRDMVPLPCFEALIRLDSICRSMRLRDVVHHDLLPSAEMITVLSQEFGIPLKRDDLLIQQHPEISDMFDMPPKYSYVRKYRRFPLDNHNEEYILRKREMESQAAEDFIQSNIENIHLVSKMVKKEGSKIIRAFPSDGKSIFNYSCQAFNSAEIAKKLLRQEMEEYPGNRFAYNHEYLSAIFDPVDEDSVLKESMHQSEMMWLSPGGFVYPGYKSSIESNRHPRKPDEARVMELRETWQERLKASDMTIPGRERWPWDKRHADFELYKKNPPRAHVLLDTQREEPPKEIRCNTALKVHRCCPSTELTASGPKASCQLARIQGLLKDAPAKLSLRMLPTPVAGMADQVEEVRNCKGFVPGAEPLLSLKRNDNIIPCYDRQHDTFKTLKGEDFRLICRKHSFRYRGPPLQKLVFKEEIQIAEDTQAAVTAAPELSG
ncbi:uncharacterized protein KIAA1257 homolog isoform X2 [Lacerta agilis]|uniref:uncharacterized protein KIAA1257 homolog isoform X2 n=1 Tax=Lacerta agilis TaxID=80427 RepID=UPI00141A5FB3|nr:uncharacterized protein KIAA1257 homolog isoform X2 [Lacerta agilis]